MFTAIITGSSEIPQVRHEFLKWLIQKIPSQSDVTLLDYVLAFQELLTNTFRHNLLSNGEHERKVIISSFIGDNKITFRIECDGYFLQANRQELADALRELIYYRGELNRGENGRGLDMVVRLLNDCHFNIGDGYISVTANLPPISIFEYTIPPHYHLIIPNNYPLGSN